MVENLNTSNNNKKGLDRRKFLAGLLGAGAAVVISPDSVKAQTENGESEERQKMFQEVIDKKEDCNDLMDEIMNKRDRRESTQEEVYKLYNAAYTYGKILRPFLEKYPEMINVFSDEDMKEKREIFDNWIKNSANETDEKKKSKLEELIKEILEQNAFRGIDHDVVEKFMNGMMCGYYENEGLCPNLS